jgi:hypothetical protein
MEAEQALPWKQGEFLRTFNDARRDLVRDSLAGDPVVARIMHLLSAHCGKFEMTPTDLFDQVCIPALNNPDYGIFHDADMPRSASALSRRLSDLQAFLRSEGVTITRGRGGRRTITIECSEDTLNRLSPHRDQAGENTVELEREGVH